MPVVKVLELVGSSPNSFQEAVQNAVTEAARTVDNITGVEVVNDSAAAKTVDTQGPGGVRQNVEVHNSPSRNP
ncbi:MAG: dodecin family protein [Bacillota bacterium]